MSDEKIKALRYRAKTDLYFLAKDILGYEDLNERVHRPVCAFFVQKKPGLSIAEQDTVKERLLLDPRGHFKTTLDIADIVQWILVFPNIRILIMSGKSDIAELMLKSAKEAFELNPKIRKLFPELCPPEGKEIGNMTEFTVPGRTNLRSIKEPTVMISTGESVKAGLHFDVIKGDDIVNEGNAATKDQIEKVIRLWNYATPLVEPYGYRDLIGTRYDESDLYGWAIENKPRLKVFSRAVWYWRPGVEERFRSDSKFALKAEHVVLLFPERFDFAWLDDQRKADPYIFNCQYLNDPTPVDMASFTEDLILRHTIPHAHVPRNGSVFQTWDLGYSQKQYSDSSVGVTGLFDAAGNLFVLDIVAGKFTPHQLVSAVVMFARKWRPSLVGIEESGGAKLMLPALEVLMRQMRMHINLDWIKNSPTRKKRERIASLQPLFKFDNLYLSTMIPEEHRAQLMKQLVKFPKFTHDDYPDAISMLLDYRKRVDIQAMNESEDGQDSIHYDADTDNLCGAGFVC